MGSVASVWWIQGPRLFGADLFGEAYFSAGPFRRGPFRRQLGAPLFFFLDIIRKKVEKIFFLFRTTHFFKQ